MSVPDFSAALAAVGSAIDLIGRDPVRFVFSLILLTILADVYGDALQTALDRLKRVLVTPHEFSEALAPLLREIKPWGILRTLRNLLMHLDPIIGAPLRELARLGSAVGRALVSVSAWPISQSTTPVGQTIKDLSASAERRLAGWSAFLQRLVAAGVAELRGPNGTWAGWRSVGGLLLLVLEGAFLFADAGIGIRTHLSATGEPIQQLPPWLVENIPVQFAIASFGSAFALGLVLFDLLTMTQLAPWQRLGPRSRTWLIRLSALLLGLALTLATLVAMWRADQLMNEQWLSPELRKSALGLGLTLPIVLLLAATALTTWGAVAASAMLILFVCVVLIVAVELLRGVAILATATAGHLSNGLALSLRAAGAILLALTLVPIALAAVPIYGVVVAGTLLVTVATLGGMAAWWLGWTALKVTTLFLDLQSRATAAVIEVLKALIDVLRAPLTELRRRFGSKSPPPGPPGPPAPPSSPGDGGHKIMPLDVRVERVPGSAGTTETPDELVTAGAARGDSRRPPADGEVR